MQRCFFAKDAPGAPHLRTDLSAASGSFTDEEEFCSFGDPSRPKKMVMDLSTSVYCLELSGTPRTNTSSLKMLMSSSSVERLTLFPQVFAPVAYRLKAKDDGA